MHLVLSPKDLFQKQEDQSTAFKGICRNTHFLNGLSSAMAEFAQRYNPSAEELNGARKFLSVLINLAEDESPPARLHIKTLNHEADKSSQPKKT